MGVVRERKEEEGRKWQKAKLIQKKQYERRKRQKDRRRKEDVRKSLEDKREYMKWKKERNKKRERRRKKKDERERKKEYKHLQSPCLSLHTGLFIEPPKAGRQRYTRNKINMD